MREELLWKTDSKKKVLDCHIFNVLTAERTAQVLQRFAHAPEQPVENGI